MLEDPSLHMPSVEILIAFLAATAVFAYVPGPAMLYAAAQTMARGRRAGWLAALGLHVGGYAHVAAASLGLAALFGAIPTLYAGLKLAGAGYLIWLGIRMIAFRGSAGAQPLPDAAAGGEIRPPERPRRAFWQSVGVELLNPKTAIFFVAFLPQFTDPSAALPIWLQLFVLGTVVNVMFSSADIACVVLADKATVAFRRSTRARLAMRRVAGGVLVALGLKVALTP